MARLTTLLTLTTLRSSAPAILAERVAFTATRARVASLPDERPPEDCSMR